MKGSQTLVKAVLAAAALGFLAAMALTGARPVQRQLAAFEPKGVLKIPPDRIRRVRLGRGANWVTLVRTGEKTWATPDGLVQFRDDIYNKDGLGPMPMAAMQRPATADDEE